VTIIPPPDNVRPVRALAVSPDKSTLAAGRGNQIHVYDAGSGTFVRSLVEPNLTTEDKKPVKAAHLATVESLAFSADGKYLASGSFQEVHIWDAQTGELLKKLTDFADRVVTLHFAPGGKMLATGGGAPTEDGEVKVFELPEGKLLLDIKNSHSDTVFGVCFSADGKMLATCGADKFVKVWEMPSGKFLKQFEGHTHHVLDVGWKPDGKLLASVGADSVLKIWDFEKGEQKQTVANAHTKQVTRLVFVGSTVTFWTASGDNTAKLWNVDNGQPQRTLSEAKDFLYGVGATADGQVVATGGEEGIVRLYIPNKPVMNLLPPGAEQPKK
jgi:WD40 repeat protein